ncbi:ketosynthase chain-length factor [Actinoplanes sp. NPDC023936]|uniref:ketosynthase chain-length factor n=1 Tax=Actinoplanes sp. NPDC023936 TaxID=3154910 RepID=UPI0033D5B1B1
MRTAVITGLGVMAPTGRTVAAHWSAVLAGRSALTTISQFDASGYPVRVAGTVPGFEPRSHVPGRVVPQTDRWTHLGLAAAAQALDDAALDPATVPEYEMGVTTASSSGGTEFGQREIEALWRDGPSHVGAYQSIAWFYAATTGQISIRHGLRGPCGVLVTEQAGGLDAIGQARRLIRSGLRAVVTGGTDASLCPYGVVAQLSSGRLSTATDPSRAYAPFDAYAAGHVPGEGGGMLIVEEAQAAAERGAAHRYGAVAGYAATFDPPPGSTRPPALGRAIRGALADAGLAPDQVGAVFADAAAVPELDRQEAEAIAEIFGPYGVPVTAPKTMTGRLYAGGASLDLVTALMALREGVVPPTSGVRCPVDELRLDLVRDSPRQVALEHVLVVGRGYGGFNAAVVLSR